MSSVAEMFRTGGVWMYVILAALIMGIGTVGLAGVLSMMKRRVPWIICGGLALLALMLGEVGQISGISETVSAAGFATPEIRMRLIARGVSLSLSTRAFAGVAAAIICGLAVWAIGIGGAIGAGSPRKTTPALAGATIGAGLVCTVGIVGTHLEGLRVSGLTGWALALSPLLLGIPCAALSASHGEEEADQARHAAQRLGVGALALIFAAALALGGQALGFMDVYSALEVATPENRVQLLHFGVRSAETLQRLGALSIFAALLYGVAPALSNAPRALDRFGKISGGVSGAAILVTLLLCLAANQASASKLKQLNVPTSISEISKQVMEGLDKTPSRHDDLR